MKIKWYGQASFAVEDSTGRRIVTDPYDPEKAGYKPFPDAADIVIKSSSSDDFHDNDHLVPKRKGAKVVDALLVAQGGGGVEAGGVHFRAIEAMEHIDHPSGHPDQNAMYRFAMDGIEIGHMGDIGTPFTEAQLDFFDGVHVLLGHAGGFPVISLEELMRVVASVKPNLLIPMHFRTLRFKLQNMFFISEFLKHFPDEKVDFASDCEADLTVSALPEPTRALVLDYF